MRGKHLPVGRAVVVALGAWSMFALGTACGGSGSQRQGTADAGAAGAGFAGSGGTAPGAAGASDAAGGGAGASDAGGNMAEQGNGEDAAGRKDTGPDSGGDHDGSAKETDAGDANAADAVRSERLSAGCNMPPRAGDGDPTFSVHALHVTGLDPVYLPGGKDYQSSGKYDFSFRPYGVRLPASYDPSKPYAVTFGGGGCGDTAANFTGSIGLRIAPARETIEVTLGYVNGCFADGGPSIENRADTPETAYFRAVLADVEASACVDKSRVFVSGYANGSFEALTLGCAAGDIIRGISTASGGLRAVRPPCTGPVAAVMIAYTQSPFDPLGPLDPNNPSDAAVIASTGGLGSAPARDDLLARNGCVGDARTPVGVFDAQFPQCMKYTGCPEKYPVIWCELPTGYSRTPTTFNGVQYMPGLMWKVLGSLPPP